MKIGMKRFAAVLLLCAVLVSTACGSQGQPVAGTNQPEDDNLRIGIAMLYRGDEWLAAVWSEFEAQCQEKGYEYNLQDGNLDNERQMQQIESFISQEYDYIVVSAANAEGIIPAIQRAQDAGIPVIAIDTPIDHPHVSTTISWDNYATGVELGERVRDYVENNFADRDTLNLVMINAPSYPHLVMRDEGFLSVINGVDKIKVVATQDAAGVRETAANIINNNIARGIDLVYGVVDNHAWGAVTALQEAQAVGTAVFSCGGFGDEPFGALAEGHAYYRGLIVVPPANIVEDALNVIAKLENGEPVDAVTNIEFGFADASNVSDFMISN